MSGLERSHLLARLREEIRRIERRPGRRGGVVACGVSSVDAALPGGGFPRGALAELRGGPASGKMAVALSLLAALAPDELFAWVDGRRELYPPAAASRGVDLARLLVVRPPCPPESPPPLEGEATWHAPLWAGEALLASGAFAVVAIDVALPRSVPASDALGRRLQSAAERGGAIGLWLSTPPARLRIPAAVRLEVATERGRIIARRALGGDLAPRSPLEPEGEAGTLDSGAGGGGRAA